MKKEKYIISRKFIGSLLLKNIMMFGVVILAVAAPMFMQPDKTSAAKKKTKQTQEYVSMSYKKGVLTIKGKGEMGDPIKTTVYENKNIKKVVIKKGVTAIADFAFKGCKKLKEIILPSTLKKIGAYAFEDCPIKNITIPKSVKSIEPGAFAGSSIKSITIPKTVKKLGEGVFGDCKKLESITMPGNIGVRKYEEPDDEYQPKSFVGDSCKSLKKIKFTTALDINILKRVGKSGGFEVLANDPKYKSVNGLLYSKDGKTLLRIPLGRKRVVISDKCTTVTAGSYGYEMYFMDSAMNEIVFPKTVKKITFDDTLVDSEHYECKNIKVTLNMDYLDDQSIQNLWRTNKYWKNSLKDELLRKGLAKLNEENERMLMLSDGYLCGYIMKEGSDVDDESTWEKIDGLVIPDNVKTIGCGAFAGYSICSITLGSSVECIASLAFGGWSSKAGLVDDNSKRYAVVYMKNNNIQIKDNAFNIGGYVRVVTL
ncbi:leucine-rich repeat domain-containing protein [Clostridium sp. AF34-13]|uniref:leucine-rich repeat domain-containing protein n=1 Tax=Clostridium sp. AF34-13 TaxID=2293012 RepID=UPI000E537DF6|nr:leucine-rich repeat domain-containing protein [Clostridium sp. AF34-13]RHP20798.1 leucine-rich repeat domain-containing protein [Clostridium sp. AF34-13]